MRRLPIRARLTAAFALAMVVVMVASGVFVYLRLKTDLDEGVDAALQTRVDHLAELVDRTAARSAARGTTPAGESDESLAQVLDRDGRLLDRSGAPRTAVLTPAEARRAYDAVDDAALEHERRVPGVEGTTRIRARPAITGNDGRVVVVAGQSLQDRDDTLSALAGSFGIGGPLAVLAASGLGYLLAGAGLRPVEGIRARAERISLDRAGERLPLPPARDELRRLAETLNEMLARLEASFERERRLVADASHELRTPLAVVKTELDTALRAGPGKGRDSLVAALAEVDHLAQLAEDLLLVARATEGKLPVRTERVEVRELLDQARDRFADRAGADGRDIAVDAPAGLGAELDPLRLRQALGNLVENALRHGRGTVTLAARARDGTIEIEVRDEGLGFPPGLVERAFERFARGDDARTRGGAGLGLAIVKLIAEAHGGTATIDTGSAVVRLSFPLSSDSQPRA